MYRNRVIVLAFASFLCLVSASIDPDVYRNFTEIITSKGYPCETHEVVTDDGYILTVFRIPYGKNQAKGNRPAVLLQHGLLDSSFTWILNYPKQSLAYILADAGFDVWMGNNRGNRYSKSHVHLNTTQKEFWDFTWDQMALHDFPAQVNYVLNQTGAKTIGFVGHSEGTLQVFAGLSYNPTFASKLNAFVALGPVVTVGHITNYFLRFLADLDLAQIFLLFGDMQFLPSTQDLRELFGAVCAIDPSLCDSVLEFLCGKHQGAFNDSRMEVLGAHEPAGTSTLNVAHFAQGIKKDNFAMFDYGTREENMKHYNQSTPPVYDLSKFPTSKLPTALFYGDKDELADPADVAYLIGHLSSPPAFAAEIKDYAHLDFVWDYTACQTFYPKVVSFLKGAAPRKS